MLTENQKHQITFMRMKGMGYRTIANELGIARDKIRNFCTKNNLNGFGTDIVSSEDNSNKFEYKICLYCGNELIQNPKSGRKKKYCGIECKRKYEKAHPKIHTFNCQYCDKQFEASSSNRKYCNNECYIKDRFWRDEETVKIIESIKEQKKLSNMSKWFKDLILNFIKD